LIDQTNTYLMMVDILEPYFCSEAGLFLEMTAASLSQYCPCWFAYIFSLTTYLIRISVLSNHIPKMNSYQFNLSLWP